MKNRRGNPPDPIQNSLFDSLPVEDPQADSATHPDSPQPSAEQTLLSILALSQIKGVGFHSICEIYDAGMAGKIWNLPIEQAVEGISRLPASRRFDLRLARETQAQLFDAAQSIVAKLSLEHIHFALAGDPNYPPSLLRLKTPPRWVFIRGDPACLQTTAIVGIIGTRKATPAGLDLARQCAGELAKRNAVVLSGLARGIDEQAHQGAVDIYGQSIAVLGYGLMLADPPHNANVAEQIVKRQGVLVSEYLPYDIPAREHFLRRNELQAALSRVIIPVECPSLESGTGATIRRSLAIGTPVIGITPDTESNASLQATRTNLERLNLAVFRVRSKNSREFWDFLQGSIPNHDWSVNPAPRQQRLFYELSNDLGKFRESLGIDRDAVGRLAEYLVKCLDL